MIQRNILQRFEILVDSPFKMFRQRLAVKFTQRKAINIGEGGNGHYPLRSPHPPPHIFLNLKAPLCSTFFTLSFLDSFLLSYRSFYKLFQYMPNPMLTLILILPGGGG